MGAFDDAIRSVKSGKLLELDPVVDWIITTAEVNRSMLEKKHYGAKLHFGNAANTDDLAPYIEKLRTLTVSGWSSTDGKAYSKSFAEDKQRDIAQRVLEPMSLAIDDSVEFKSTKEDITGDPLMGTSPTHYKLTIPANILEPILKQENQLDGPGRRSA